MKSAQGFAPIYFLLIFTIIGGLAIAFYLGNLVNFMQESQESTPFLTSPVKTPSLEASTQTKTAIWKTFTGKSFTFKYPDTWFVLNDNCPGSDDLILLDTEPREDCYISLEGSYTFAVLTNYQKYDLDKEIIGTDGYSPKGDNLKIGGTRTVRIHPVGNAFYPRINLFLNSENQGFLIAFPNQDLSGGYDKIYDQILSTFKFLE